MERRRSVRVAAPYLATLVVEGDAVGGTLVDLCQEAVLVQTSARWPVGTQVRVHVDLPRLGELCVDGRIVRTTSVGRDPALAIVFEGVVPRLAYFLAMGIREPALLPTGA